MLRLQGVVRVGQRGKLVWHGYLLLTGLMSALPEAMLDLRNARANMRRPAAYPIEGRLTIVASASRTGERRRSSGAGAQPGREHVHGASSAGSGPGFVGRHQVGANAGQDGRRCAATSAFLRSRVRLRRTATRVRARHFAGNVALEAGGRHCCSESDNSTRTASAGPSGGATFVLHGVDLQVDSVGLDRQDFGVMVEHEPAQLFHRDVQRHGGDQHASRRAARCRGVLERGASGGRFELVRQPVTQLHDHIAADSLGFEQRAVGAAQHRVGRVAGLNLGDAEADRDHIAVQRGLRQLADHLPHLFGPAAAAALVQSAHSITNSSPP